MPTRSSTHAASLTLDRSSHVTLTQQIVAQLVDAIRTGQLPAGARLPGTRWLAARWGVHRSTVVAAFDELSAQGWVEAVAASGTFVTDSLPDAELDAPSERVADRLGFDLPERSWIDEGGGARVPWMGVRQRGVISLQAGQPDTRLLPAELMARAYRRRLRLHGPQLLGYGDPQGELRLREALGEILSARRGLRVDPAALIITRGSQMGLYLVARTLLSPGDRVAVEAYGYPPAWEALRATGAELLPVEVDAEGLSTDALDGLARRGQLRAVYVTPHHQYPTMVTLSAARRLELLELAARHGFCIIEDDYDNEFHFEGKPVLPLASLDRAGHVIYVGTLSKVLAPGLRIGYVVAPRPLIERLVALRTLVDRQGDRVVEAAVADLLEDGEIDRHIRRVRRRYRSRRDRLLEELSAHLPEVTVAPPAGGMALWAAVAQDIDADAWTAECLRRGVQLTSGSLYRFDRRADHHLRLGFAASSGEEIREGVARMVAARNGI